MNNLKYASYFENYLGALDGTNIEAHIPYKKQIPYQHRKKILF